MFVVSWNVCVCGYSFLENVCVCVCVCVCLGSFPGVCECVHGGVCSFLACKYVGVKVSVVKGRVWGAFGGPGLRWIPQPPRPSIHERGRVFPAAPPPQPC